MINGIKLEGNKEMSLSNEIVDVSDPNKVYIPLINNNVLCECITKSGRKVKKGTIIGIRKDLDFPILSSVSGKVIGIKKCLYLNNKMIDCVVIENDKKETTLKRKVIEDITSYSKEGFVSILKECAVTGMGGSDFPTYLKYNRELNILIVNAVECEPYITSDLMLARLKSDIILETIDAIMKINNISKCFIAYKKHNSLLKDSFIKYISNYPNIVLFPVKDIYPMGWERHLVKYILKLEYDKYPSEVGVVVNNISTVFAIYKALKFQRGVTKRIVTISGCVNEPVNVLAKVGMNMSYVIRKLGGYTIKENLKVIAGGPMMGTSLRNDSVIMSNNLNAITMLPNTVNELNNCMGCGRCIKVCPSKLCPVFILKNIDDESKLKSLHPEKCVECGLCSYICPSKIGLRDAVKRAKREVK